LPVQSDVISVQVVLLKSSPLLSFSRKLFETVIRVTKILRAMSFGEVDDLSVNDSITLSL
jgi:hypothetical protein